MKHCPKCNSSFPDGDKFCEVDGTLLVSAQDPTNTAHDKRILPLLAVIGVTAAVVLVFVYLTFLRGHATPEASANSNQNPQPQVATFLPSPVSPAALVSPSVESSPSPSPPPSPSPSPTVQASPSLQASATPIELTSNPIAAAAPAVGGQVIIRLVNGARIEADESWQTGEGIWYRKGTVVSLLDPKSVKSIDKVAATPAPTVTPAPSPF
jgi:hypothetical protein